MFALLAIDSTLPRRGKTVALAVSRQKRAGAYYTDSAVARFLATWAMRTAEDRVLEPCFGEGVFLAAATDRQKEIGGQKTIVGNDIEKSAWQSARLAFPDLDLRQSDFFELTPEDLGLFDAIIGNPPFIRYQHFSGSARTQALARAAAAGTFLPALSSAWAPFLIHAAQHLRVGGRLAVVAPFEITYARYARPVVEFLSRSFGTVRCLMFESPLFPALNENTVLLLCDRFGSDTSSILVHHLQSVASLELPLGDTASLVAASDWATGLERTRLFDLSNECQDLYTELLLRSDVLRLGDMASVTIGYVSGDNDYFHLDVAGLQQNGIHSSDVRFAIRRGANLARAGLELSTADADQLSRRGNQWLFFPTEPLSPSAAAYVEHGERRGVPDRYKCRVRNPWYKVPGVRTPDMLLTLLSSNGPRLVVNETQAVVTNSILTVDSLSRVDQDRRRLAAAAMTSFSQLSAEIEGHALGGGALKLEPSEARQWSLPINSAVPEEALAQIDRCLREGQGEKATAVADAFFLVQGLGLDRHQLGLLRRELVHLRQLRNRGKAAGIAQGLDDLSARSGDQRENQSKMTSLNRILDRGTQGSLLEGRDEPSSY